MYAEQLRTNTVFIQIFNISIMLRTFDFLQLTLT